MNETEKMFLEGYRDYDTITRLDINEFRVVKGKESYHLYTDLRGTLGRKHAKGFKGLLGELRKNKKYSIKELLNEQSREKKTRKARC